MNYIILVIFLIFLNTLVINKSTHQSASCQIICKKKRIDNKFAYACKSYCEGKREGKNESGSSITENSFAFMCYDSRKKKNNCKQKLRWYKNKLENQQDLNDSLARMSTSISSQFQSFKNEMRIEQPKLLSFKPWF